MITTTTTVGICGLGFKSKTTRTKTLLNYSATTVVLLKEVPLSFARGRSNHFSHFTRPPAFRFRAGTVFTLSGGTLRTQLLPRVRVLYAPPSESCRFRGREASAKKKKKGKRFSFFTLSSFYPHYYYYYSLLLYSFSSLANPLSFSSLSFSLSWSRRSRRE